MRSFEHLIGVFEGSSTAEERFLEGKKGPARFLDTFDPAKEAALARRLAEKRTWQCPTLYWERGQWLVDTIDVTKDPDVRYAPASWQKKTWPEFSKGILKDLATDPLPVRESSSATSSRSSAACAARSSVPRRHRHSGRRRGRSRASACTASSNGSWTRASRRSPRSRPRRSSPRATSSAPRILERSRRAGSPISSSSTPIPLRHPQHPKDRRRRRERALFPEGGPRPHPRGSRGLRARPLKPRGPSPCLR